jgi:MtfA peptidase
LPGDSLNTNNSAAPVYGTGFNASSKPAPPIDLETYQTDYSAVSTFVILTILGLLMLKNPLFRFIRRKQVGLILNQYDWFYHSILEKNIPYYTKLSFEEQQRFLRRTVAFMKSKRFHYYDMKEEPHVPLLISAAAVQLSFGLKHYLLKEFDTIHVLSGNYRFAGLPVAFEGHVSESDIFISWESFVKSFEDYSDGNNVGLHEMAHALSKVNADVEAPEDELFAQLFKKFNQIARPVFYEIQTDPYSFLGAYAATNMYEFWAVCVEQFFERPQAFQIHHGRLYEAMTILLNQDPLQPQIVLEPIDNE